MFARSLGYRAGATIRSSGFRSTIMPLRAKVLNPAFAGRAQMVTASTDSQQNGGKAIGELSTTESKSKSEKGAKQSPKYDKEDVLFDTLYGVRTIELNRPEKLHTLSREMIRKIAPRLKEWAKSDMANVIIIKGSGPKAFCAGGDVIALAEDNAKGAEGQERSTDYFALEYQLDHLIATYTKPYVAFMDGITMGGGVGLSIHAPFRIATEKTIFSMPETKIGFFPDVGASFFLPRMPGSVGTYLALTGDTLKGVNVFYSGVATHYVHSTSLPALEKRLAELQFKDYDNMKTRNQLINATIEEYCTGLPHDEPIHIGGELRNAIDRCFSHRTVTDIISALKEEGKRNRRAEGWAQSALTTLHKRSPTSVHVALHQMRLGKTWSITETFQREHQIAAKFMRHPDFTEGVNALLVRKTFDPQWQPKTLEDVESGEEIIRSFFSLDGERLKLWSENDYMDYPFQFGVPREEDVQAIVNSSGKAGYQVVNHFLQKTEGKQGVKEVVIDILQRKTTVTNDGTVRWT